MKTILMLCALIVVIGGGILYYKLRAPSRFGTFNDAPTAEGSDLIEPPASYLHKTIALEGVVREQCTTMGCYFFFHSGNRKLRVDISEIAMNAPRRNGHHARVEGQIVPYADGYQFWASAVQFQ